MAGIAGIAQAGRREDVRRMLEVMIHRGGAGREVFEAGEVTLGAVWPRAQPGSLSMAEATVQDASGDGRFARAAWRRDHLMLDRDAMGVAPLYFGRTQNGTLCFASEVKSLLTVTSDVFELPPGGQHDGLVAPSCSGIQPGPILDESAGRIATELRNRLESAVVKSFGVDGIGVWLSGGLDSSILAALARRHVKVLHTFATGLAGAPDLVYARQVADFIGSEHHEIMLSLRDVLRRLPEVIRHLESFDALLVRSSVMNYSAGKAAASFVPAVLSGEGGDELFAGYDYLKALPREKLAAELLDIIARLHNTALQRVDRCSQAHGLLAVVPFLDPIVVEYALRIPAELKLHNGIEKWILRQAIGEDLPEPVRRRTKAKFWEGTGVGDLLARHADESIPDGEFLRERTLSNGWRLNSKEELLYYRLFRDALGDLPELGWMGRTKGA